LESIIFYTVSGVLLIFSIIKDKKKTLMALKKTVKGFSKLLPQMIFILLLVGLSLSVLSPESISGLIGSSSGIAGIFIGILTGAISLLPSFIAFPLGATLLEQGAGLLQVAGFISALMGIGILTFPMEKKYFGTSFAIYRNVGSLIMTLMFISFIALFIGVSL